MKTFKLIFSLAFFIMLFATFPLKSQNNFHNTHYQDPYNPAYDTGVVLVKFKDNVDMKVYKNGKGIAQTGYASVDKFLEQYEAKEMKKVFSNAEKRTTKKTFSFGGETREVPQLFNIYKIELDTKTSTQQMVEELQADPLVEYAEPNYYHYVSNHPVEATPPEITGGRNNNITPNDPLCGQQYNLTSTQINQVWDTITGDSTQVIAILDTGVDWTHPDLDDNIWRNNDDIEGNGMDDDGNGMADDIRGWDFISNDNNPMDDNSHGTHVAGIAAAEGNNGIGIAGVNWQAKIMPIKVFPASGYTDAATIVQGINYASDNNATILNMSFGSYGRSLTMEVALQNAYMNADLVASAGNDGETIYSVDPFNPTTTYPAALSYVLGVEANEWWSNYDPDGPIVSTFPENFNYELKAPGSGIISTGLNGDYISMSGTSMSAPLVAGAISLYRGQFPEASKEKLWGDLVHTLNPGIRLYDAFYPGDIQPQFDLFDYAVEDTLAGNDQDGQADAGELIQIYTTIRNTWGHADSVYALLSHSIYSDPDDVNLVKDSVFFGSMSTYGSLVNLEEPFLVRVDSNCFNNRNVTMTLTMKNVGNSTEQSQNIDFQIYNGAELTGILLEDTTLTPDKLWLINNNVRVSNGVTLTILPGTHLENNAQIDNRGQIIAEGTSDSLIFIKGSLNGNGSFKYIDFDLKQQRIEVNSELVYCNFSNGAGISAESILYCTLNNFDASQNFLFNGTATSEAVTIKNTKVINTIARYGIGGGLAEKCLFDNIVSANGFIDTLNNCVFNDFTNIYVYLYPNFPDLWSIKYLIESNYSIHEDNSFLTNNMEYYFVKATGSNDYLNFPNQYWGTTDEDKIKEKYYDFNEEATLPYLNVDPILTAPSELAPGHVWKVHVNGIDAQDGDMQPLGVGEHKFDVYFNRAMDTTVTPLVSFGVRSPFLQNIVSNSASWSADKKIWTAYFDVGLFTGDGIQTIRVADAKDSTGSKIPVEDDRFDFVIQAAGVQSMNFIATPGIGKVDLEWNNTGLEDFLGFNMYRYMSITDSTYSEPQIVNPSLITDTVFSDFNVIPDSTYHFYYKVVDTDLKESDSSNVKSATPFTAANGDANGSMEVNVLDITTIVNYMLGNAPEPFLFDAADVNYDGNINVLDIIGVVQIIQGNKSDPLSKIIATNITPAYISKEGKTIRLESEGNVAALSFELQGEKLDKLKLLSKAKGFEFALSQSDSLIKGVMFSLSGSTIPEGKVTMFEATEPITATTFGALTGGDWEGNYVPVLKEGEELPTPESYQLQAYPNPFTGQTTIQYDLPEQSDITITIYDMSGKVVWQQQKNNLKAGNYEYLWNSSETKGMYLLTIQAKGERQNWEKQVKLVKMK